MSVTPETKEQYSAHIPALATLINLGWTYLPQAQCLAMRGGNREVLLRSVLTDELKKRRFTHKGKEYPLSPNAIENIVQKVASPGLNEGLLSANERIYTMLTLGVTVTEFINGKKAQPTIPLIDWKNHSANSLLVTEEFEVLSEHGTHTRRPDIICFVNGIPLAVIEAKRPESGNPNKSMVAEGISQNIRNQGQDEIPILFAYAQLLLSVSSTEGRYATTKTPSKFWAKWREEELKEDRFANIKNDTVDDVTRKTLFADKPAKIRSYFESLWSKTQLPTDQDRLLISLLSPDRLLEFVRYFLLFDKKVGKIAARYQQAFGIKALVDRINKKKPGGGREGGVIWHTTGSGKSFTMVFLCKALLLYDSLKECRIVVVTDRVDLEKQLARTFLSGGAFGSEIATRKEGERAKVSSGRELAFRISQGNERIIFTIINKFNTASRIPACHNPSDNLIVLIDEGHRSQGGENHERMRKALPNAAYVAFTGTPLLKDDKTTSKFGPIVHAYTMKRAVEDGTVTPLLYEERKPELEVNETAIDNWFEKITNGLNDIQKVDLKRKYGQKGPVYGSANRIDLIAWDIAVHFDQNIKSLGTGLKGQLATDSKLSAIRYKKALDETGLVSSTVIISSPDSREGHKGVDEAKMPEVQQWWKDNVGHNADYERDMVDAFSTEGDPDILIVVDKLLTGFDEPRNAVLYIDKQLKEHSLVQAIARVNRLHEHKRHGLLIDYRGILKELDTAIADYQDLASRTQGGYDIDDIDGLYSQMSTEYKRLPSLHDRLWAVFKAVENRKDLEQYRQVLVPKYAEDDEGESYDTRQKVREDFYAALTEFGMCLKVALSSQHFFEDASFTEETIARYKTDLKFFTNLRKIARQDAQETVDFSAYEEQIRKLVDKHVIGTGIDEPDGVILVDEMSKDDPKDWSEEKTRNETDIIRTRVKKTIEQTLADDPFAQKVFSQLLREAIEQAEALFDHPNKQYVLFSDFEDKVNAREVDGVPDEFGDNQHAKAYYGTFRIVLGDDRFETIDETEQRRFVEEAKAVDEVVRHSVAEHSINPQNIETDIRKGLLPRLFKLVGLDAAKKVIDQVIQITRVGLSRGDMK
ncbi:MAG: type I restriction endonuclease subunit R [Magnetococcales bacterium]|nr:type I restriction endonuclease subunit R [Magnetococcales bacterium]